MVRHNGIAIKFKSILSPEQKDVLHQSFCNQSIFEGRIPTPSIGSNQIRMIILIDPMEWHILAYAKTLAANPEDLLKMKMWLTGISLVSSEIAAGLVVLVATGLGASGGNRPWASRWQRALCPLLLSTIKLHRTHKGCCLLDY